MFWELLPLTCFQWYRRMVGGKWSLWTSWIVADIWVRGWNAPEALAIPICREDWTHREDNSDAD